MGITRIFGISNAPVFALHINLQNLWFRNLHKSHVSDNLRNQFNLGIHESDDIQ